MPWYTGFGLGLGLVGYGLGLGLGLGVCGLVNIPGFHPTQHTQRNARPLRTFLDAAESTPRAVSILLALDGTILRITIPIMRHNNVASGSVFR